MAVAAQLVVWEAVGVAAVPAVVVAAVGAVAATVVVVMASAVSQEGVREKPRQPAAQQQSHR